MIRWAFAVFWLFAWTIEASADATDDLLAALRAEGYSEFSVSRTWLGRVRIVAQAEGLKREVVLDPRNGAILRDYISDTDDTARKERSKDDRDRRDRSPPPSRNPEDDTSSEPPPPPPDAPPPGDAPPLDRAPLDRPPTEPPSDDTPPPPPPLDQDG